jgi:hypothetical protein
MIFTMIIFLKLKKDNESPSKLRNIDVKSVNILRF